MNKTKYVNTEGQPELQDMLYKLARSLGLEATNYKHEGAISFDSRRNLIDCSALRFREGNGDEEISVQEFITLLKSAARKEESVRLNDQYTAIVSKDGVKAGCQSFPLSVIDDLAKAKERVLA